MTKTFLLENDNYMWEGLEDFCKSFDPEYKVISTQPRDYMVQQDYMFIGMLSQPSVERLIVASAFESLMSVPNQREEYWQVEHFAKLIEGAFKVREKLGMGGLNIEINYHNVDFIKDIKEEIWGWDFSANIRRFIRQNPEKLVVNLYKEYKFVCRLTVDNTY